MLAGATRERCTCGYTTMLIGAGVTKMDESVPMTVKESVTVALAPLKGNIAEKVTSHVWITFGAKVKEVEER
jgi:hypothetical protein